MTVPRVTCQRVGSYLILRVSGSLTVEEAEEWSRALKEAWQPGVGHILVDLSRTDYLDTGGVALLLSAAWQAERKLRKLTLVGLAGQSLKVLRFAHLSKWAVGSLSAGLPGPDTNCGALPIAMACGAQTCSLGGKIR